MIPDKTITILFGSQTGNSQDVAERIGRQVTRLFVKPNVCCLSIYPISEMMTETLVIFVCSTTGNGEIPDTMKVFWKFLCRKNLPSNSLSHLKFCVIGMGDSAYEKFNVVAKKLNKRLLQLGASEFLPLTLADDQHELGYDAALDQWLPKLKETLISFHTLNHDFISDDALLPPRYSVSFTGEDLHSVSKPLQVEVVPTAILKTNKRVTTEDHFQAVHLLEFTIDPSVKYHPGDVAVVRPKNPKEEVEEFLSLLHVSLDKPFALIPNDLNIKFGKILLPTCTVRECVTSFFDIMSVPRRSFFEFFHFFSKDETEKEKLVEFTTAAGQEELYTYCNRPKRTILEVFQDFPNTTPHIPFEYLFDMVPSIRPRSFSIASSLSTHPNEFHLIVAVVEYNTRLRKPRRGLCSNWITQLPVGSRIPFSIKNGSITLPQTENPLIMVGPGTGCAPFRSFIEQRAHKNNPENYLFFGCRYEAKDFLFRETWNDLCGKKLLTLFTSFSRDQEDKVYVQHRISENGSILWDLINDKDAFIYVAGNSKQMPESVKGAFLNIIKNEGHLGDEASQKFLARLQNSGRYQIETWA